MHLTLKSELEVRGGLPKVWQGWVLPWSKSPSNQSPNLPSPAPTTKVSLQPWKSKIHFQTNLKKKHMADNRTRLWLTINQGYDWQQNLVMIGNRTNQLGLNHVCVILSHRRDTIMSAWYYVSHLQDTLFHSCFWHRKKYLAEELSLDLCNTVCIHSKFSFQIIFVAKKILR